MKTIRNLITLILFTGCATSLLAQVPQIMGYQGRVVVSGANFTGTGQFKFALVNSAGTVTYWSNDGTSAGGGQPTAAVSVGVTNGLFTVGLGDTSLAHMTQPVPYSVFGNSGVYVRIWFNDGSHGWQWLSPDVQILSVGYAMQAANVASTGDIVASRLDVGSGNTLSGSLATIAGGQSNTASGADSVVAGGLGNTAADNAATIGGGRWNLISSPADLPTVACTIGGGSGNRIYPGNALDGFSHFATISGGESNVVWSESDHALIGGGFSNQIGSFTHYGSIGGGSLNRITGAANQTYTSYGTIGGGYSNSLATGGLGLFDGATVSGGIGNTAGGVAATVPGGSGNQAGGDYSLAAGHNAQTTYAGTFVWADNEGANFSATANNQFLIRASGGVGIGTANPADVLDVRGNVRLGTNGEYFATAGSENLRIVRGIVEPGGTIYNGTGFSVTNSAAGTYSITFSPPFADAPALIITPYTSSSPVTANCTGGTGAGYTGIYIWVGAAKGNSWWNFIAIGKR